MVAAFLSLFSDFWLSIFSFDLLSSAFWRWWQNFFSISRLLAFYFILFLFSIDGSWLCLYFIYGSWRLVLLVVVVNLSSLLCIVLVLNTLAILYLYIRLLQWCGGFLSLKCGYKCFSLTFQNCTRRCLAVDLVLYLLHNFLKSETTC